jgi:hypothetical protein
MLRFVSGLGTVTLELEREKSELEMSFVDFVFLLNIFLALALFSFLRDLDRLFLFPMQYYASFRKSVHRQSSSSSWIYLLYQSHGESPSLTTI